MSKKSVLILFAHPNLDKSHVQKKLITYANELSDVYVHDLYEQYPDFNIHIEHEKDLLLKHDIIIWQHPVYWYSCPPLLKQWIDLVLEYGWAYGKNGVQLKGKWILNCVSSGGAEEAYQKDGRNRYSLNEFFRPFEQTARLCGMHYLPPFAIQGVNKLSEQAIIEKVELYKNLLSLLIENRFELSYLERLNSLNEACVKMLATETRTLD